MPSRPDSPGMRVLIVAALVCLIEACGANLPSAPPASPPPSALPAPPPPSALPKRAEPACLGARWQVRECKRSIRSARHRRDSQDRCFVRQPRSPPFLLPGWAFLHCSRWAAALFSPCQIPHAPRRAENRACGALAHLRLQADATSAGTRQGWISTARQPITETTDGHL